jgi:hypothetical protein
MTHTYARTYIHTYIHACVHLSNERGAAEAAANVIASEGIEILIDVTDTGLG